jgi:hypothetical protein
MPTHIADAIPPPIIEQILACGIRSEPLGVVRVYAV